MTEMQRIRTYYKVPAKRGMRVRVDGKLGRITSARGPYLMVRFDDCRSFSKPCHPTWRFEYEPRRYAVVDGRRVLIKPWCGVDGYEVRWTDSCTGCFEAEDGHPVGEYPRHPKHGCYIGAGCSECGYRGVTVRYHWVALDMQAAVDAGLPCVA